MSPAACESNAEHCSDPSPAIESYGDLALCHAHLSDAARRARACHPAYAGRIRLLIHPVEPPVST